MREPRFNWTSNSFPRVVLCILRYLDLDPVPLLGYPQVSSKAVVTTEGFLPMSFEAYLRNIQIKTGKGPDEFRKLAEAKGFLQNGILKEGVKAGAIVAWLKEEFELGHGHAMAIVALFKGKTD
jgi:hypothetical protein